ncbi:hypothetical protein M0R45_016344 [Rubus argutus]|uniref:Peptidase M16 middle/third domain-containing protein n=1 Tax=Rubus argutus TaxID=59490 RepID=A0AAW1XST4_RUBAR
MDIHLTDSGLDKIFEIIGLVYQYIKLLHQVSPQEWIFRELQDTGNMEFRFAEEQPQDDYASELAGNLLRYAAEHPSFKSEDFQCEPWFGSHYTDEDISPSLIDFWKDPPEIDVSLHLPEKNEFIPSDFSIRSDGLDPTNASSPICILDEPLVKLWYKLDNELNEIIYQASVAKLETSLSVSNDNLELKVYGFNDKLPALLSKILTTTKNFMPTSDRYMVIKENMERKLKNTNIKPLITLHT